MAEIGCRCREGVRWQRSKRMEKSCWHGIDEAELLRPVGGLLMARAADGLQRAMKRRREWTCQVDETLVVEAKNGRADEAWLRDKEARGEAMLAQKV